MLYQRQLPLLKKLLVQRESEGFSLVELVVVIAVLSTLSAVAIPAFLCVTTRARAAAALATMKQIQKECIVKESFNQQEIFSENNLQGYQISTNSCEGTGGDGLIRAIPSDLKVLPTFILASQTNEISYNFKGKKGTDLNECLSLICFDTKKANADFRREIESNTFVRKDTYFTRKCSSYVVVDGPKWAGAQEKAERLGGTLITINDEDENQWVMDTYRKISKGLPRSGCCNNERNLFIGLKRDGGSGSYGVPKLTSETVTNDAGYTDGWVSGENSTWRPPHWGNLTELKMRRESFTL